MLVAVLNGLKSKLIWLIGNRDVTGLEVRIFNAMCLLGIVITAYNIPFSFVVELYITAGIFILITLFLAFLYYLARFKNSYRYSVMACGLIVNLLFAANYFYADGISGSSLLSFTLLTFLIIIISPKSLYLFWFILIFSTVWLVMLGEYFYPVKVHHVYDDIQHQILDIGSTVSINIIVISLALIYLKNEYYREKIKSDRSMSALKELNNQKTKLFSVLSHDIKTSLYSLNAYLEMVKTESLDEEDRKLLETHLSSSVHSTQAMLSNILHWSKGQLFLEKINLKCQDIAVLLNDTFLLYKHEAQRKNIHYKLFIEGSFKSAVHAEMFKIIIGNLITNALKFTREHGLVQVFLTETSGQVIVEVRDNGQGIDDLKKNQLFSLNIDSTYGTLNEKGVGLGLYLCKQFATDQGANMWFESTKDVGTSFFVSFLSCG